MPSRPPVGVVITRGGHASGRLLRTSLRAPCCPCSFYDDTPGRTTPAGLLHLATQVVQAAAQLPSLRYLAVQVYPDLIEGLPSSTVEQLFELRVPGRGGGEPGVRTVTFFSEANHAAVDKLWPPSPATPSALDFVASMPASSWIRLLEDS